MKKPISYYTYETPYVRIVWLGKIIWGHCFKSAIEAKEAIAKFYPNVPETEFLIQCPTIEGIKRFSLADLQ